MQKRKIKYPLYSKFFENMKNAQYVFINIFSMYCMLLGYVTIADWILTYFHIKKFYILVIWQCCLKMFHLQLIFFIESVFL